MGVFVYRGLRIGNLRVYVYLAANGKAVCLAFCCTEESYPVGYLGIHFLTFCKPCSVLKLATVQCLLYRTYNIRQRLALCTAQLYRVVVVFHHVRLTVVCHSSALLRRHYDTYAVRLTVRVEV